MSRISSRFPHSRIGAPCSHPFFGILEIQTLELPMIRNRPLATLLPACIVFAFLALSGPPRVEGARKSTPLDQMGRIYGLSLASSSPVRLILATSSGLFLARPEGDAELLPAPRGTLMSLAVHPKNPATLLLGGHTPEKGNLGVLRSTNGGMSWKKISDIGPGQGGFHLMEISKANPDVVYGVTNVLHRSTDGGRTWHPAGPLPQEMFHFAASSLRPERLFAATRQGLLVSHESGAKWEPIHPLKRPATMIHVTPRGRLFAFVVGVGLITAPENNPSWSVLSNRFQDRVLLRLAIDPSDPKRFYAVTHTGAVVISRDGGKTWGAFEGSHNANPGNISRGRKMFDDNCKGCHGIDGQGGIPGNQAPALDDSAHAWHHSDRGLVTTILEGSPRQGSPMIAWKHLLSRKDAESIVAYLKSSWSFRSIACQGARHMACMRRR